MPKTQLPPAEAIDLQGLIALVLVVSGVFRLTIGGAVVESPPGTIVRMPARVPHAVEAVEPSTLLLIMLRDDSA
jgi:quercetin dioxygenase-like cupin family protein